MTAIWWRGEDSNLRRLSRQIYSLIPLTAREPLRIERRMVGTWIAAVNLDSFLGPELPWPERSQIRRTVRPAMD